ncbi:MAG TPA: LPP20 family lipoprotein [Gammaproteobacteria bacterium]
MNRYLTFLLALSLAACASTDRDARPDWLDGSSEEFPARLYVIGIGSADELSTARDRARADLAKTFRVSIDARSTDAEHYRTQQNGAGAETEYSAEIQRDLTVHTRQVLEGVTLPASWQDPETRRYHALAVLNRAHAATRLREDIGGLDAAAETLMNRARAADDAFTRAKLALETVENQRQRGALQDMLRAVDAGGRGVPPRWPLAELEADLDVALSRIVLRAEGDDAWRTLLAGQLADSGFTVNGSGDYAVRLIVDDNAMKRDGWHWLRGTAALDVTGPDGRSLGQQRWNVKASATDAGTAETRFREQVAEVIAREGRDAILGIVRE